MKIAFFLCCLLLPTAARAALDGASVAAPRDWPALLARDDAPYLFDAENVRDWGDVLYRLPHHPQELDDPALSAATREFGPVIVPLASLPFDSGVAIAKAAPWSSWWFPKIDRDLFDDGHGTSPLEKYDRVRLGLTGKPSRAAAFERNGYNADRPHWEGLCDAWAIAATVYPEPKQPRTIRLANGAPVTFSVGDLKALLLETVSSVPIESLKKYGQRFTGNADGWIFPDIFPQELLRYVQVRLFEKHESFVMDHDPGVEVWSEPVYKASYTLKAIPGHADSLEGKLWLFSAGNYTDRSEKDKTGIHEIAREYDFLLYGAPDDAGRFVVDSGEWIKGDLVDSRADHPDFVYHVADPAKLKRASQNPEIDPAVVDKIVGR